MNHSLYTYSLFSSSDVFAAGVDFISAAQSKVDVYFKDVRAQKSQRTDFFTTLTVGRKL